MSRSRPAIPLDAPGAPLEARLRTARALAARHRRLAAALCAGVAVLATVSALSPAPASAGSASPGAGNGPSAISLPAGTGDRPAAGADRLAVTVRLADPAGLLLLRAGSHVEVVGGAPAGAAGTGGVGDAEVLAADAVVLAVPPPGSSTTDANAGLLGAGPSTAGQGFDGVLVLSVVPSDARRLAGAAGTRPLTVAVALPSP